MKTDDICSRYAGEKVGLTIRLLNEEVDDVPPSLVLIEGRPRALRMLAEVLVAMADESREEGFQISPTGAGSDHFSPSSELGIYIHRLPE